MRKPAKLTAIAASFAAVLAVSLVPVSSMAEGAKETIAMGKKVAYDRKLGNCLACHMMDDGVSPGDLGPPLVAMKTRFPDPAKLRAQLEDPMAANANTMMPPFGKHNILTDDQLDAVIEYLYTL
ncbi:heterodimeric c-type cytochrome complex SoxAX, subunit X [Solemya velum gill symbiont]|uniref:Heterodimeric c-type cytochrome complex SoxAX, subunit X n=1 Tax=Solemya velum gill symbiont TaxID=2340 RepID=A0A0B0HA65_SOVGS|nr:sulfur oxidation c-type cytochrome SoxX [Solemya velum gill symbiont]KHF24321.1 heterodimeric c-type cytochrome complex SoxAX, subunit X [Solemya velum gill symbiont]